MKETWPIQVLEKAGHQKPWAVALNRQQALSKSSGALTGKRKGRAE
jgi:hypothetical protein